MNVWFDEMSGMIFEQESLLPTSDGSSDSSTSSRTSSLASKFKKFPTPTSDELDILFEEFYKSKPIHDEEPQVIVEPIQNNGPVPNNNHESSSSSSEQGNSSSSDSPSSSSNDSSPSSSPDNSSHMNVQEQPSRITQTTNPLNTPNVYVPLDFDHPDYEERVLPSYNSISQQNSSFNDDGVNLQQQDPLPHAHKWTRMQKYHPTDQIIGNPQAGVTTRTSVNECLVALSLSNIEPKTVSEALRDPEWVKAMQDELV